MTAQLKERKGLLTEARTVYTQGCKQCPQSVPLWIGWAALEEKAGSVTKARAVLENARKRIPKNPQLWYVFADAPFDIYL